MMPKYKPDEVETHTEENNKYTCSNCKQTHIKGQSDQEALQEHTTLFPDQKNDELVLVCDPCFIKIMEFMEPGQKRYAPFVDTDVF
jgi:hypothetical protein